MKPASAAPFPERTIRFQRRYPARLRYRIRVAGTSESVALKLQRGHDTGIRRDLKRETIVLQALLLTFLETVQAVPVDGQGHLLFVGYRDHSLDDHLSRKTGEDRNISVSSVKPARQRRTVFMRARYARPLKTSGSRDQSSLLAFPRKKIWTGTPEKSKRSRSLFSRKRR